MTYPFDSKRDLKLERVVDLPLQKIWSALTTPEHIRAWFAPTPWSTSRCTVDLRPGGLFHVVLRSPDGKEFPGNGCYLEVVPQKRLIWTDSLGSDFRPAESPFFTAVVSLEAVTSGIKYTALALHATELAKKRHEEMGFLKGWSQCLDQLLTHMRSL